MVCWLQEWAIAEQKETEQKQHKPTHSGSQKIKTVGAHHALRRLAGPQSPLQVPRPRLNTQCLENYFLLLSALEDNLVEFKSLTDRLTEVIQWNLYIRTISYSTAHTCTCIWKKRENWKRRKRKKRKYSGSSDKGHSE